MHESKGLEFDDVSFDFLRISLITDKIKVVLYNFFEDSTATPNQWRLVLNGVSYEDRLQDAPTFDETRHASVCTEVGHPRSGLLPLSSLVLFGFVAEILVCRDHSGSAKALDRR